MRKKINEDLLRAYGEMVPKDLFDQVEQNIVPRQERTVPMKNTMKLHSLQKWIAGAAAALILVACGTVGGIYYANNLAVDSLVDIDVNPGIELSVNKKERVLRADAINEDALEILGEMDLKNTDLNVAVNAIIGSMVQKGYLEGGSMSGILISVQNDDPAKADEIRKTVIDHVHSSLQLYETEASIINQTIEKKTDAASFAKEHSVSLGKAVFLLKLAEIEPSLKAEELAAKSLSEIAALVKEKGVDISRIVDYDADDSLWENITDEIEDINEDAEEGKQNQSTAEKDTANNTAGDKNTNNTTSGNTANNNTTSQTAEIGVEKAKSIALNHAGLTADQVTFTKAKLDRDDGTKYYDIEFYSGNTEYDYEIHAESGKVLEAEKDRDDDGDDKPQSSTASTTPAAPSTPTYIGVEKAKSIALSHAGVEAADARFEKAEMDQDDGVVKYEIEFNVGNTEYSYEIRATDGTILDSEKDIDD